MFQTVHINIASIRQLTALLSLTPGEALELIIARPFTDLEALQAALPPGVREQVQSLELSLRDLNQASRLELMHLADVPPLTAALILAHRPFHHPAELKLVPGVHQEMLERICELFTVARSSVRSPYVWAVGF